MKKVSIALTTLMIGLVMFGCKSRETGKLPETNQPPTPFIYAPLPPFHKVFAILDYLRLGDFDQAVDDNVYETKQEIGRSAFALGVLTADGIISVRAHNKKKIDNIYKEVIRISNFLGLDASILRLANEMKDLINSDNWDELEKALENYKTEVETSLYQSQQYDLFTMMMAGGWVEGINRISWFVDRNFQTGKTNILEQKGTLNHLLTNLDHVVTPSFKDTGYFMTTREKLLQAKQIIDKEQNGLYTREQVKQLIIITDEIKDAYAK